MAEAVNLEELRQRNALQRLLFFEKGAMSFIDKEIRPDVLQQILAAAASCAWLGKWKLLYVTDRAKRVRVVEAWQNSLRKMGLNKDVEFIERWKIAPLFVVFCQPEKLEQHRFVPPENVRTFSILEVGGAVRSLELLALIHEIGLHGIMGVLVPSIGDPIKGILRIPDDYEIVYFGVIGYAGEEVDQKLPALKAFCYAEEWGNPIDATIAGGLHR